MPTFTNDVTPEHRKNREKLATHFPAGRDFLVALELLHAETDGRFHLGTDQNLHLYLEDRFLVGTHRGGSGGWTKRQQEGGVDVLRIAAGAPEAFFADLLITLRALR